MSDKREVTVVLTEEEAGLLIDRAEMEPVVQPEAEKLGLVVFSGPVRTRLADKLRAALNKGEGEQVGEAGAPLNKDGLCPVCHQAPEDRGFVHVERRSDGESLGSIYCWHGCHGTQIDYRGRTLLRADQVRQVLGSEEAVELLARRLYEAQGGVLVWDEFDGVGRGLWHEHAREHLAALSQLF